MEIFNEDALSIGKDLGLEIRENFRGMKYGAGFPVWMENRFVDKTLLFGKDLTIVDEGVMGKFIKDRHVRDIYRIYP